MYEYLERERERVYYVGWVYSRFQDSPEKKSSKFKQPYWSRAKFWIQRFYDRVQELDVKNEVLLM